jgi:hypothetical protein
VAVKCSVVDARTYLVEPLEWRWRPSLYLTGHNGNMINIMIESESVTNFEATPCLPISVKMAEK